MHEEINRLPEGQRLPVVLCDLEGLSYEQAAQRLGWTVPTLGCRLAKARQRLRARLTRRGVTASALGVLTAARTASAAVPAAWTRSGGRGGNDRHDLGHGGRINPDHHQGNAHDQDQDRLDGRPHRGRARVGWSRRRRGWAARRSQTR